jgi:hypothetical protein
MNETIEKNPTNNILSRFTLVKCIHTQNEIFQKLHTRSKINPGRCILSLSLGTRTHLGMNPTRSTQLVCADQQIDFFCNRRGQSYRFSNNHRGALCNTSGQLRIGFHPFSVVWSSDTHIYLLKFISSLNKV